MAAGKRGRRGQAAHRLLHRLLEARVVALEGADEATDHLIRVLRHLAAQVAAHLRPRAVAAHLARPALPTHELAKTRHRGMPAPRRRHSPLQTCAASIAGRAHVQGVCYVPAAEAIEGAAGNTWRPWKGAASSDRRQQGWGSHPLPYP